MNRDGLAHRISPREALQETRPRRLDAAQIAPYRSPYLTEGFREDEIVLESMCMEPASALGCFRVVHAFLPAFHLSGTMAYNCVAQLCGVYACLDNGLSCPTEEIVVAEWHIVFGKPVRGAEFAVSLALDEKNVCGRFVRYRVSGTVADNAFTYASQFVFPLADGRSR